MIANRPNRLYLTFALVALSLVSAESAAAKCARQLIQMPGLEPNDGVIFVDGVILQVGLQEGQSSFDDLFQEGQSLNDLDPSAIHSIEITCWNPKTGEIGGGAGIPVIAILTKDLMESPGAPSEADIRAKASRAMQELFKSRGGSLSQVSPPA